MPHLTAVCDFCVGIAIMLLLAGCAGERVITSAASAEPVAIVTADPALPALAATAIPQAAAEPPAPEAQGAPAPAAPVVWPRTVNGRFLVALDPGHGGDEVGAAANGVVERDSNLDMAQRVERFLREAGVDVLLTRSDSGRAAGALTGSGFSATRGDLQARVKAANVAGATAFVSLHSNGSPDVGQRGVEVYYESRREFADESLRLARHVLDGTLDGLATAGYPSRNRGLIDAACWRNNNGRCIGLFVLSPAGSTTSRMQSAKEATAMPAVLAELLFVSNADDAALLSSNVVRDSMARGVAAGILSYLGVAD